MGRLSETQAANGLTKLNWVAQRWPESGRRKIETAIAANPRRVLPLAVRVAIESGDPIGVIAAEWLEAHPDRQLAEALEPRIPHSTTALREMAGVVETILYASTGDAALAERARHANNRAVRLSDLGRRDEALAAAEEAVGIYRKLAAARPDAFLPDLARSLGSLGAIHSAVEDHAAARRAFAEGVGALAAPFASVPAAHARSMAALVDRYRRSCEAAGEAPDDALLGPITASLASLSTRKPEETA